MSLLRPGISTASSLSGRDTDSTSDLGFDLPNLTAVGRNLLSRSEEGTKKPAEQATTDFLSVGMGIEGVGVEVGAGMLCTRA